MLMTRHSELRYTANYVTTPQESALSAQPIHYPNSSEPGFDPSPVLSVPNPDDPPWGVWQALAACILSVGLLLVVPQLCALPYVAVHYQGHATREVLLYTPGR